MTVVSIDPGDSTGVAVWSGEGQLEEKYKVPHDAYIVLLDEVADEGRNITTVVVEDFKLRNGQRMNVKGSKLVASQGIGVAQAFARRVGAKLVKQSPQVLQIAAMHAGVPLVSHFSDDVSAYLHGFYWFETQGILVPKLQQIR